MHLLIKIQPSSHQITHIFAFDYHLYQWRSPPFPCWIEIALRVRGGKQSTMFFSVFILSCWYQPLCLLFTLFAPCQNCFKLLFPAAASHQKHLTADSQCDFFCFVFVLLLLWGSHRKRKIVNQRWVYKNVCCCAAKLRMLCASLNQITFLIKTLFECTVTNDYFHHRLICRTFSRFIHYLFGPYNVRKCWILLNKQQKMIILHNPRDIQFYRWRRIKFGFKNYD